ncbi:hypothetical protein LPJ73_002610 [Coemansia sp. RSA 2703]|nr:hypothetical protein LPJ73_002610 [Coemansia sp. RSA 2703]
MNPNYRIPSPAGTSGGYGRRRSTMTNVLQNPPPLQEPQTFSSSNPARYTACPSMDIPRRMSLRNERVIQPESRSAGIGGFQTFYHRSGIGNNVRDDRDSGIGKICIEDSSRSASFSSIRRRLSGRRASAASVGSVRSVESVGSVECEEDVAMRATENFARLQRKKRGEKEERHGHLFKLFHPHAREGE